MIDIMRDALTDKAFWKDAAVGVLTVPVMMVLLIPFLLLVALATLGASTRGR